MAVNNPRNGVTGHQGDHRHRPASGWVKDRAGCWALATAQPVAIASEGSHDLVAASDAVVALSATADILRRQSSAIEAHLLGIQAAQRRVHVGVYNQLLQEPENSLF